jgi:hypothetical protein
VAVVDPVSNALGLVYSTLHGDGTLMALITAVRLVAAPPGTAPDYCVVNSQSATDTNTLAGVRLLTRLLIQVQIVGPIEDFANLQAAYARADALLQPGGTPLRNIDNTLACFREQQISYGEMVNGKLWYHHGGTYRVEV